MNRRGAAFAISWTFASLLAIRHLPAAPPPARHPNLLLNAEEIERIKLKIKEEPWAARLFERAKALAERNEPGQIALCYALTREKRYGDSIRQHLTGNARYWSAQCREVDLKRQPESMAWGTWGLYAWAYDLTYDVFTPEERLLVEGALREISKIVIEGEKLWTTTPNLVFGKHHNVGLVGYALGDEELIDWALNDPGAHGPHRGGFYPVLDTMIKDGHFWGEAPIYALHYDVHGMIALAEAARHYDGTDLYGYVSKKSGASIKSIIDGYLLLAYPLERTGVNGGSVRMATFGDGSTWFSPSGEVGDTFLVNPVSGNFAEAGLMGELEAAYTRYGDPGYAWILSLNPDRNVLTTYGRSPWGSIALTHGSKLPEKPAPPPAPCGIYPSQGFAMLRAEGAPAYWTSGALAVLARSGAAVGHGHEDYFSIIFHGKGRLLYPDVNVIQYEPTYLNWTREGIGHSTLLVDGQSPRACESTSRNEFTPDAKFFAIAGSPFDGVRQLRALLLTREYLADIFRAGDDQGREHTFDWVLHGIGKLHMGEPAAYRPSAKLMPNYWWIDDERSRTTGAAWQADWVQRGGGATPGLQAFGEEWFAQSVGVRMTMLAGRGAGGGTETEVFCGDGPMTDGPPHHRIDGNPEGSVPLVVARRTASDTTFAAVHEPYDRRPSIRRVRSIAETDDAVGIAIDSDAFSDRVLVAFEPDRECTLKGEDGERFVFRDYGYVRVAGGKTTVRGKVSSFELRASDRMGDAPADIPAERRASLHYSFMPEEIHLSAGKEKEIAIRIRCVGEGQAKGRLRFSTPAGIQVEPAFLDLALSESDERTLPLRIRAASDAVNALHEVRIEPEDGTPAAAGTLLVSVGVVMTEDRLRPRLGEYVIRAPGYTMRVDQFSGVSYYLLDGDGHRRFGRIHNTNFIFGFPGVMRDGKWSFAYRHPCRFIWKGKNTLTVGCDGTYNDHDVRLGYAFEEDRITIALIPPTRSDVEHTVWLGNFDSLGAPRRGADPASAEGPATAWYFFPHPVHRQGVLLTLPEEAKLTVAGTAVNFPLRTGEKVVLRFATAEEVAVTLNSLLHEMVDRTAQARLPEPAYRSLQASSYNRESVKRGEPGWFADSDGTGFIRTETIDGRTEWVILEHQGPGAVTKMWTPFFYYNFDDRKGPNLRIYLDGDRTPTIDENFIALVSGRGSFAPPFGAFTARAGNTYMPIPFAKSCKVTLASRPFYYIINYRAYPPGTRVETFRKESLAALAPEIAAAGKALIDAAPLESPGVVEDREEIDPGAAQRIDLPAGPAAVGWISVRVAPPRAGGTSHLRSTVIEIGCDGERTVWCPAGEFFSCPDSIHPFHTWERSVAGDGTMTCRWVMPYRESARIEMKNLGSSAVLSEVRIGIAPWTWDDRSLLFHAAWRPDELLPGTPIVDWNFIDIQGRGIFVGDAWTVLNPTQGWWGEGDEKIYVDGAWDRGFPTHFGTGTEDYYGWAGGVVPTREDEFDEPFLANVRVGGEDGGRTRGFNICARTRALDAIPFDERLRFDMEASPGTDQRAPSDFLGYSAVTFWYARPGARHNRPPHPDAAARPIMSLADLAARGAGP